MAVHASLGMSMMIRGSENVPVLLLLGWKIRALHDLLDRTPFPPTLKSRHMRLLMHGDVSDRCTLDEH